MFNPKRRRRFDAIVWTLSIAVAMLLLTDAAFAEGRRYAVDNATYRNECGSCHIAYPPALLGAIDWRGLLAGLDRHFGTDASLDAGARKEITAYLERAAGQPRRGATALRISDTAWFRREHDEVRAATWKRAAVQSASNCGACHRQADRGDFSEHSIHIPR